METPSRLFRIAVQFIFDVTVTYISFSAYFSQIYSKFIYSFQTFSPSFFFFKWNAKSHEKSFMSIRMFWIRSTVFCANKYIFFLSLPPVHLPFNGAEHNVCLTHSLTRSLIIESKWRKRTQQNRLFATLVTTLSVLVLIPKQRRRNNSKLSQSGSEVLLCYTNATFDPFHLLNPKNVKLKMFQMPTTKQKYR